MTDKDTRPPHNFVANHLEVGSFEEGFRAYAQYRDLGMVEATNGMVRAHVIKLLPPFNAEEVSKRHAHDVEFQLLYCLKGWMKGEYDGEEVMMREGSCWLQPPTSSIRFWDIPTIASCRRLSCRPISIPKISRAE